MKNRSLADDCAGCSLSSTCVIPLVAKSHSIDGPPDRAKTYRSGEYLLCQEKPGQHIPVICQGLAAVILLTDEGEEILIQAHGPGNIVDPSMWIRKQRTGSFSAKAVTEVTLRFVTSRELTTSLKQSNTAQTVFLDQIRTQLQADQRTMIILRSKDTYWRIQFAIHELIQLLNLTRESPIILPHKIPRWFLSSYTALRPETVSRMLSRLRAEGLIAYRDHHLVIPSYSDLLRRIDTYVNGWSQLNEWPGSGTY
jgi:CRP-like cAMP-binding protein